MLEAVTGLLERELVTAVIVELFLSTDRKDWPAVARAFAPQVRFDMSSVGAGPETTTTPDAIVAGWRTGLESIEHVHHQAGNFIVSINGSDARAFCYGIAYHFRSRSDGRNTRVFVGSYHFELHQFEEGWRITAMRFNLKFIEGNRDLENAEAGSSMPGHGPEQRAERAEPIMPSRDLDETRTFFQRLGFTAWFGPHSAWPYEILSRGNLVLHFFLDQKLDISKNYSGCYWRVVDADRLHGEFMGHSLPATGIPRMTVPRNENWGMREFAIVDPSGNLMRIGHSLR